MPAADVALPEGRTRHLSFTGKGGIGKISLACATALAATALRQRFEALRAELQRTDAADPATPFCSECAAG